MSGLEIALLALVGYVVLRGQLAGLPTDPIQDSSQGGGASPIVGGAPVPGNIGQMPLTPAGPGGTDRTTPSGTLTPGSHPAPVDTHGALPPPPAKVLKTTLAAPVGGLKTLADARGVASDYKSGATMIAKIGSAYKVEAVNQTPYNQQRLEAQGMANFSGAPAQFKQYQANMAAYKADPVAFNKATGIYDKSGAAIIRGG